MLKLLTRPFLLVSVSHLCFLLVFLFVSAAMSRAGSIRPTEMPENAQRSSVKLGNIKPLPKRRTIIDEPEKVHASMEAWFSDVVNGKLPKGVTKEQAEVLRKLCILIEAPADPKVRGKD
jgi:hypothetical protein